MDAPTMNFPLTVPAISRRGRTLFGHKQIVTRLPDRSLHRVSVDEMFGRSMRHRNRPRSLRRS